MNRIELLAHFSAFAKPICSCPDRKHHTRDALGQLRVINGPRAVRFLMQNRIEQ
jgi:hypothetical protein